MDLSGFVLAATTADLADEPRARPHADAVEFRMDLADEPLAALRRYDGDLPVVATNRAAWEGGHWGEDGRRDECGRGAADDARLDALAAAAEVEAVDAVDVELASVTRGDGGRVVERAREAGAAVVVSAHDFEGTPAPDEMRDRLSRAADHGDVAKLAVTARSRADVLALLSVTHDLASDGVAVATMAMGEAGRHSRAVAPLYGSRLGYAPVDADGSTAPGQYDLETLAGLLDALGVEGGG